MSRFRIFMLLATVVALAGALSACGGGSDSSDEDPKTVIEDATLEGVKSGTIDLALGIVSEGEEAGTVDVSLSGPFQSRGAEALPEFGFEASAKGDIGGEAIDFDGSLTLLSDRAFIGFEGTDYEIDPTTFGFVKSGFEQGLSEGGASGSTPTACQEAAAGIDLTTVVDNLENEGSADVDGTSTTKVSGDLDPEGAIDAIIALTEDPACSATFEAAGPLPLDELEAAKGEVSEMLKKAHAEIYVGDDGIIRKVDAELTIEPKDAKGEKVEIDFEMSLGAVNEDQEIEAPANAEPLEGLFKQLGVDPLALLEEVSSGEGLGGLLEGLEGDSAGGGGGELELPDVDALTECLKEARSAADVQKCTNLSE
ncbi:MAG: hypothetical protein QOE75_700 [Solirubrobacterales bacterium]|nr:hypothetical protein [Solirubrobacterales bacterium]